MCASNESEDMPQHAVVAPSHAKVVVAFDAKFQRRDACVSHHLPPHVRLKVFPLFQVQLLGVAGVHGHASADESIPYRLGAHGIS